LDFSGEKNFTISNYTWHLRLSDRPLEWLIKSKL
jgi:hypothetical protein